MPEYEMQRNAVDVGVKQEYSVTESGATVPAKFGCMF